VKEQLDMWSRRLAEWLDEWRLYRALAAEDDETGCPEVLVPRTARIRTLRVRDIVLLDPRIAPPGARALFLGILDSRECEVHAAPFGPLSLPGFTGELALPERPVPLRVLCLWNARWLDAARVAQGWKCGRLSAVEYRGARKVWQAWHEGRVPPKPWIELVGPPWIRPDDPRREYEQAEADLMDTVATSERLHSSCAETSRPYQLAPSMSLLAAEEKPSSESRDLEPMPPVTHRGVRYRIRKRK
jgi:hypothetical protein